MPIAYHHYTVYECKSICFDAIQNQYFHVDKMNLIVIKEYFVTFAFYK